MICDKCNNFFQPTPEEERLIVAGAMPGICTQCASNEWRENVAPIKDMVIYPGVQENLGHGNELWHAIRFDKSGRQMSFVRVPMRPIKHQSNMLRNDRPWDLKVFVMSEKPGRLNTIPRTRLLTNVATFRRNGVPLWVRKIPAQQDVLTGTARITVPALDVVSIEQETVTLIDAEHTHVHVALKDGGRVLIKYR